MCYPPVVTLGASEGFSLPMIKPSDVLDFWLKETPRQSWYRTDLALDDQIRMRFEQSWRQARRGGLGDWEDTAKGALALVILLDQFSRNMFRGKAEAFATDALVRAVADRALARGFDRDVPEDVRSFFYMPFMHSEDLADQDKSVALFRAHSGDPGDGESYAVKHRNTIVRFGRFPARNAALGRETTQEEIEFLAANPMGF